MQQHDNHDYDDELDCAVYAKHNRSLPGCRWDECTPKGEVPTSLEELRSLIRKTRKGGHSAAGDGARQLLFERGGMEVEGGADSVDLKKLHIEKM